MIYFDEYRQSLVRFKASLEKEDYTELQFLIAIEKEKFLVHQYEILRLITTRRNGYVYLHGSVYPSKYDGLFICNNALFDLPITNFNKKSSDRIRRIIDNQIAYANTIFIPINLISNFEYDLYNMAESIFIYLFNQVNKLSLSSIDELLSNKSNKDTRLIDNLSLLTTTVVKREIKNIPLEMFENNLEFDRLIISVISFLAQAISFLEILSKYKFNFLIEYTPALAPLFDIFKQTNIGDLIYHDLDTSMLLPLLEEEHLSNELINWMKK